VDRTLPKARWTHEAHFAAATWFLKDPAYDAPRDMPRIIWRYNEAVGGQNTDTDGYHETITQASLMATNSVIKAMPMASPIQCLQAILASKFARSDWLFEYWHRETLFSTMARRVWVAPDLKALDF
jgi:hypothetical protein